MRRAAAAADRAQPVRFGHMRRMPLGSATAKIASARLAPALAFESAHQLCPAHDVILHRRHHIGLSRASL